MARVAIGVNEFVLGGGPVLAMRWGKILIDAGHDVLVVGGRGGFESVIAAQGPTVWMEDHMRNMGPIKGARDMVERIRGWKPDVFVTQHLRGDVVAQALGCEVYSVNVCLSQFRRLSLMRSWAKEGRVATCYKAFGTEMEAALEEDGLVKLIPLPVEERPFVGPRESQDPVVGTVCRHSGERVYGLAALIKACVTLNLRLDLVGTDTATEALKEWVAGIEGARVNFRPDTYPAPYTDFDIHFSMGATTALEGAMAGVPTVVWNPWTQDESEMAAGIFGDGPEAPGGVRVRRVTLRPIAEWLQFMLDTKMEAKQQIAREARQYVIREHVIRARDEFLRFLRLEAR